MRVLALDHGAARCGVAISDPTGTLATPVGVVERLAQRVAPVPVELYDERLTTAQARRSGGRAPEDSRAAAHLLEAWLISFNG